MTPNAPYWIGVEWSSSTDFVYWLEALTGSTEVAVWTSGAWTTTGHTTERLAFWVDDYKVRPNHPVLPFTGVGADGISRVWIRAGRALYYVNSSDAIVPIEDGAGVVKLFQGVGRSNVWYRAPADTSNWLYIGFLDTAYPMVRFNGDVATTNAGTPEAPVTSTWETLTGHYGRSLCVHNGLLCFAYNRNLVDCYNGTLWTSATPGCYATVGDATYVIRNLVSWDGYLWAGKPDGLYKITIPVGYPVTGALSCEKIIDFSALAINAPEINFAFMQVHQGDLWFSIGNGLMRYTTGGVLTATAPDSALNVSTSKRQTFKAGISVLGNLFILGEGDVSSGVVDYVGTADSDAYLTGVTVDPTVLYAYTEGHWHPLAQFDTVDQQFTHGMCAEPGWYGEHPKLWFGLGMRAARCDMPMTTQRRWLVPSLRFATTGYMLTSWFDGNIRNVVKDWMEVQLDISNSGTNTGVAGASDTVRVYWRPDDATAWVALSAAFTTTGLVTLTFPAQSYSYKCQLKIELVSVGTVATPYITTPRVEAIVVKYMERPDDIRSCTRTYKLADRQENRNGVLVTRSLEQQLSDLRTLREKKEPLTFHPWYAAPDSAGYTVHIVDYSVSELPEEQRTSGDKGMMLAVVRLQEL